MAATIGSGVALTLGMAWQGSDGPRKKLPNLRRLPFHFSFIEH